MTFNKGRTTSLSSRQNVYQAYHRGSGKKASLILKALHLLIIFPHRCLTAVPLGDCHVSVKQGSNTLPREFCSAPLALYHPSPVKLTHLDLLSALSTAVFCFIFQGSAIKRFPSKHRQSTWLGRVCRSQNSSQTIFLTVGHLNELWKAWHDEVHSFDSSLGWAWVFTIGLLLDIKYDQMLFYCYNQLIWYNKHIQTEVRLHSQRNLPDYLVISRLPSYLFI